MISNGAGCDTVSVTEDEEPSLPPNGPLPKLTKYTTTWSNTTRINIQ